MTAPSHLDVVSAGKPFHADSSTLSYGEVQLPLDNPAHWSLWSISSALTARKIGRHPSQSAAAPTTVQKEFSARMRLDGGSPQAKVFDEICTSLLSFSMTSITPKVAEHMIQDVLGDQSVKYRVLSISMDGLILRGVILKKRDVIYPLPGYRGCDGPLEARWRLGEKTVKIVASTSKGAGRTYFENYGALPIVLDFLANPLILLSL